jgi:hypothetical protein
MYICVTHVDAKTKIPGYKRPMRNGPTFPEVKGLNIIWWDQSNWPLQHPDQYPRFYGTCDDDADTTIEGIVKVLTEEEYNVDYDSEMFARLPKVVTARQARLALFQEGLLANVESSIESLEEPQKTQAKIEWEYATEINRFSPFVEMLGTAMGLTKEQLNDLFVKASRIGVSIPEERPQQEPTEE